MNAIAAYEQRYGGVTRRFELYSDRILIHGRRVGSSFDLEYDFAAMSPLVDRAKLRPPLFYGGFILLGIAGVGFLILALQHGLIPLTLSVVGLIACVGALCIALRSKQMKAFMFKNRNGEYLFEVLGVGRDAERVDEFAALIVQKIRDSQAARN